MNDRPVNTVDGELLYCVDNGITPVNETSNSITKIPQYSGDFDRHLVRINDGRVWNRAFNIDVHGFELIAHKTSVTDFMNTDMLNSEYYLEIEDLVKKHIGAKNIHIFDHTIRTGDDKKRKNFLLREPVKRVHNDYTDWSGPQRVRDLLPKEADKLLSKRFSIIQVWRPIQNILEKDPLAICDSRSIKNSDLIISERRYPDRVGQTYQIKFNKNHEWFYFPKMTRDEAIIFKVYDSETDGRSRFTPHTSFVDPNSRLDAPERESIEVRILAFF